MKTQIDHLVVVAQTLEQGVLWCEATMGITPGAGGEHALYGTHNRLFKIATPANPLAYLEIIAVNPKAVRPANAQGKRWFDMDDAMLRAAVAKEPQLVHFVVGTDDIQSARVALKALNIDRGPAVHASRHSRRGLLQWQITVRDDGQRLFNGALPTLIQWGKPELSKSPQGRHAASVPPRGSAETGGGPAFPPDPLRLHPRNSLPRSGVTLHSIAVTHPSADKLQAAYQAIGLTGIALETGPANIAATLHTPKGAVTLHSQGI